MRAHASLVVAALVAASAADVRASAPTEWRTPLNSPACKSRLADEAAFTRATRRPSGFYCKSRPLLYSPSRKLGYLKTPKAASLAIQDLFQRQFTDYRWASAHEVLPSDAIVFTFVREPLRRALSAYAEIDVAYALRASPEARNAMHTVFHHINRKLPSKELPRLMAFLDDLVDHRFGGEDREHWMPTHAYSQMNYACHHSVAYIGKLENQEADWQAVQALANIPPAERSHFPHGHDSANNSKAENGTAQCNRACQYKAADMAVTLSKAAMQRICDTFASDFLCLGYPMPPACTPPRTPQTDTRPASAASATADALDGATRLPGGPAGAAPVYVLREGDALHLAQQRKYRNTLFLVAQPMQNHSTLYKFKRGENHTFGLAAASSEEELLRSYDRYGWYWRGVQGAGGPAQAADGDGDAEPLAPQAVAIPTRHANGHHFSELTPEVRLHIERGVCEAMQLLLLHSYDRVLVVGHGLVAGIGTLHPSLPLPVSDFISSTIARLLVDPLAAAAGLEPLKGWAEGRRNASAPHAHFLPGRR